MAYKLRCDYCKHTFNAYSRSAQCPKAHGRYQSTSFIGEVLDTAVDVALAYTGVTAAVEVAEAVGGLTATFFNWD